MFKGLIFFVREGWKYDKLYVLWNIFYQLTNAPIPVIASLIPKIIIDELIGQKRMEYLIWYVIILAGYTLAAAGLSAYFRNDGFTRRCRVAAEFDAQLHKRLYECDYANLENPDFWDMQEKAKKFLYCNWHGFGYILDCALNICGHIVSLIGIILIIATLNLWIILLFITLTVLGAMIEGQVKKKIKQLENEVIADQRGWTYHGELFEKAEYGKEFRIYCMGEWLSSREREFFTRANRTLKRQNDEYIKSGVITAIFTFIQQCAAYGYLIYSVLVKDLSIGNFTMYISAITVFASSFRQVMSSIVELRAYDMYYDNLEEYLNVPITMRAGKKPVTKNSVHTIEFKNVSFQYPGSGEYALKDINLILYPGQKLLIVGENGAGKTTFIKLLLRLYDPTEGEILLDGVNIQTLEYDSYMSLFSTVFQDYKLYSFSLRDNVSVGAEGDDPQVEYILRKVGLGEKLDALEKGTLTAVYKNFDETGFEPSGGEGQKIAIARALYKDAPMVILDEPTAALDPQAEFWIFQQFEELVKDKSAVYISHRLSSAKFCDVIAVFEQGNIIEYGTHSQLLEKEGRYAQLFKLQSGFYNI